MRYRLLALALSVSGALMTAPVAGPALAAGDAAHGKAVFARCAICHKAGKDEGDGIGPNLFGIAGRKAASEPGFGYSGPLKNSHIVWTDANLTKWVAGPTRMVPGTKMAFPGLSSKKDQRDVVAYLDTLK